MLFHVTFEVYEDIVLPETKSLRNEWLGPQMQKIQESGKVRESGLLSSKRAGFFIVDIDTPEELYELSCHNYDHNGQPQPYSSSQPRHSSKPCKMPCEYWAGFSSTQDAASG